MGVPPPGAFNSGLALTAQLLRNLNQKITCVTLHMIVKFVFSKNDYSSGYNCFQNARNKIFDNKIFKILCGRETEGLNGPPDLSKCCGPQIAYFLATQLTFVRHNLLSQPAKHTLTTKLTLKWQKLPVGLAVEVPFRGGSFVRPRLPAKKRLPPRM